MTDEYAVRLSSAQLRVLHELTSMVLNAPDQWQEIFPGRGWQSLGVAHEKIEVVLLVSRRREKR